MRKKHNIAESQKPYLPQLILTKPGRQTIKFWSSNLKLCYGCQKLWQHKIHPQMRTWNIQHKEHGTSMITMKALQSSNNLGDVKKDQPNKTCIFFFFLPPWPLCVKRVHKTICMHNTSSVPQKNSILRKTSNYWINKNKALPFINFLSFRFRDLQFGGKKLKNYALQYIFYPKK